MKTIEQLMKPRLKVIADYPHNPYEIGQIIEPVDDRFAIAFVPSRNEFGESIVTEYMVPVEQAEQYPQLFVKAHWAEQRKQEDFPAYVVCDDKVEKVLEVKTDEAGYVTRIVTDDYPQFFNADIFQRPATAEEYEAYKKANP